MSPALRRAFLVLFRLTGARWFEWQPHNAPARVVRLEDVKRG